MITEKDIKKLEEWEYIDYDNSRAETKEQYCNQETLFIKCSKIADDDFKMFIEAQTTTDKVKAYELLMLRLSERITLLRGAK